MEASHQYQSRFHQEIDFPGRHFRVLAEKNCSKSNRGTTEKCHAVSQQAAGEASRKPPEEPGCQTE
mgnify:CR=1 FL=1